MLMVKPALAYLDVIRAVRESSTLPLFAYNVSGEYSMLHAAAAAKMIDLDRAILAYAVKYASAFYGPFREAAQSAPSFGDRRAYQMQAGNAREAIREARLDEEEGADMLMVKPAGPYLDIIQRVRAESRLPLAAYQVSGEYAMLKAAAERGWIDEPRAAMESLLGIRRAGADLVITYYAKAAARWLAEGVQA